MNPTPHRFRARVVAAAVVLTVLAPAFARAAEESYPPHPDALPQPGVPKGEVLPFHFEGSKIFPGTRRDYWIYVPAQYSPDTPACVYVQQDGVNNAAPAVFDNLIAKHAMPVTIGVFVKPGVVPSPEPDAAWDRFNRSFEYDGMGDGYVRFLLEELLPDVETKHASDGRAIRLSKSGNDRAIGGQSSGAICAFTAAWERPEAFSRVFSAVGTYVALRGGDRYPGLVRKTEPRPIRVFLQDGSNDNNIYAGSWWLANQSMESALSWAGYEVNHVWGEGAHNGRHAAAIFPDAMRWLWHDWPQPVKTGATKNVTLAAILLPGEDWKLVSEGHRFTEGPAVNAKGEVFFNDAPAGKTFRIALDGTVSEFLADSKRANGEAFGPDGRLYTVSMQVPKVLRYETGGSVTVLADDIAGNDIVVDHRGNIYLTNPPPGASNEASRIWLIRPDGGKQIVDTGGVRYANGITISPDQTLLLVADHRSHWVYSYRIQPDGTLAYKQRFDDLHVPDQADQSNADGIRCDRAGRRYVATNLGIQVCDQAGRVNAILPTPNRRVSNLVFGGETFDTLFAMCGDKVFKRRMNVRGANAWAAPNKTEQPKL